MSAHDVPVSGRAMSIIVAIALVVTALAPLVVTASKVVA